MSNINMTREAALPSEDARTSESRYTAIYCKIHGGDHLEIIRHDEPTFDAASYAREEHRAIYHAYAGPFADVRDANAALDAIERIPYAERRFEDAVPGTWTGPFHRLLRAKGDLA